DEHLYQAKCSFWTFGIHDGRYRAWNASNSASSNDSTTRQLAMALHPVPRTSDLRHACTGLQWETLAQPAGRAALAYASPGGVAVLLGTSLSQENNNVG